MVLIRVRGTGLIRGGGRWQPWAIAALALVLLGARVGSAASPTGVVDLRGEPSLRPSSKGAFDSGLRARLLASSSARARVIVSIEPGLRGAFERAVAGLGVALEEADGERVQLSASVGALDQIASLPGVRWIDEPVSPFLELTGEGVGVIDAGAFHRRGVLGSGVKVGVLDLGFQGYQDAAGNELPLGLVVRSFRQDRDITGDGEPHGTAVAEVIHDVAPGASLYLANFETDLEMSAAVDWMIANGVRVINASFGWTTVARGDGTGFAAEVVARAVGRGVLWVGSAGNFANRHWRGTPRDSDGDRWANFQGEDETISLELEAGDAIQVDLRWDDWSARRQDLDLYLLNSDLEQVASSRLAQVGSRPPVESLRFRASTSGLYHMAIWRYNVTRETALDLFVTEAGDPEDCAAAKAVEGLPAATSTLASLRFLRDAAGSDPVLAKMIPMYYRHSPELVLIFARRPELRRRAGEALAEVASALRADRPLGANLLAEITGVRDEVLRSASVKLQQDVREAWSTLDIEANSLRRPSERLPVLKIPLPREVSPACRLEYCVAARSLAIPADARHSFTVGATEWRTDAVTHYSSRGPTVDGRIKPDLVAPAGISSTVYGEFHGTSASAPHVAGAAALLLERSRSLVPAALRSALERAALDRGARGKDSVYGAGRLRLTALAPP